MRTAFLFLALAATTSVGLAQDFDRLTIRPYWNDGLNGYRSGIVTWCQADGWPSLDPECIGLRAPEAGVSRYTMTFGEELPEAKACIKVDETGQWYYENCGGGEIPFYVSDSLLLDNDTGNETCSLARGKAGGTGVDVFYLYLACGNDEHVQWAFRVPPDFTTAPVFTAWTDRSGTGADDYNVQLRCKQPDNNEDFTSGDFDDSWTASHNNAVSGDLTLIEVSLVGADMEADDLCVVDFEPEDENTNVYFALIR